MFHPSHDRDDPETMIRDAIATIDAFASRFNARDLLGMDSLLHFPHLILSGEKLMVWDEPGQVDPDYFLELAETGWSHSIYHQKTPVLVSPRKVHLVVDYTRNRADGSAISQHQLMMIVTCENGFWGIKQRSY
jgi:hypothetical protein